MAIEYFSPSPLSHFDPADLLDGLSTGVIVLDAHLCVVYANVGAQDLLAVGLNQARGRPLTQLFDDSQALDLLLRRSLERGEPYAGRRVHGLQHVRDERAVSRVEVRDGLGPGPQPGVRKFEDRT